METIRLDLPNLDPTKKKAYALLTEPKFRCCLEGINPNAIDATIIYAIGLEENGKPIGLALASFYEVVDYSEIHSINIDINYKTPKILTNFLGQIENILFSAKSCVIIYRFFDTHPLVEDFLPIFEKAGWDGPNLKMIRYFFDAQTFNPSWYDRPPSYPPGYFEFPWKTIKSEELKQIQIDSRQGHFSPHVSPFYDKEIIEPLNSIGLRHKKQVIGWMICHRVAPDTIRYTSFYIKPEFCFTGYQLRLLVDSMRKHQESNVKWALFELSLEGTPFSWVNFVQKRLAPLAQAKIEVYETWKNAPSS